MGQRLTISALNDANSGVHGATFRFPQSPRQGVAEGQMDDDPVRNGPGVGAAGFRLTIIMNNANGGSLTPAVREVANVPISGSNNQGVAEMGHTWQKSAAITANGTYTITVYPGLVAATGNDDVFNDILGYEFMVIMTHGNANKMTYDAFIDLVP